MSAKSDIKPVERTFYSPILDLLRDKGFQGVQEISPLNSRGYIDILLTYENRQYIIEVKISDKPKDWIDGIVQVYGYSKKYSTRNLIVICYPEDVTSPLFSLDKLREIAIDRSCKIISLTDEWHGFINLSVEQFFSTLQSYIDKNISSIQAIETTSKILKECIVLLSNLINKEFDDKKRFEDVLNHLTKNQGLFLSLCGHKDGIKEKTKLKNQVIDLLAYILVNQIIFYFLYSKKVEIEKDKVEELKGIDNILDLHKYFNQIKKVDFKPIYDIDVVSRIPTHGDIIDCINKIVKCLSPLRVDELKYDLYGKLIGRAMPKETREILASYYTKTNSAELLAKLLIENWDESVWDLACGSGTLLVSSYKRKKDIYEGFKRSLDKKEFNKLHKTFIQEQLTGTDIMPFACHLTGLNLSAQNLNTKTDFMRILNKNSLEIDLEKDNVVKEAYGEISNAIELVQKKQKTIQEFSEDSPTPITYSESKTFFLEKVDTVMINPPFTPYNNIPKEFRDEFFRPELIKIADKRVGLWSCFLVLADRLVKAGGKIGAIIPISFLRGRLSNRIRNYYLDNYSLEYIIKPKRKSSFSEDTTLTDLILIARKNPPEQSQETNIILLHKPVDLYTVSDIDGDFINRIKTVTGKEEENEHFTLIKVKQTELRKNSENLVTYMFGENLTNMKRINQVYEKIKNSDRTKVIESEKVQAGKQFRPKGKSKKSVIARRLAPSRVSRTNFYFDEESGGDILEYYDKKGKIHKKNKNDLRKTFRSLTGVNKLDITELYDYEILPDDHIEAKSQVLLAHKMRLDSDESYLISVYSKERILPTNALTMYFSENDIESRILTLYFSSIFYLTQFKRFDKKTTEGYLEIGEIDMGNMYIPDLERIPKKYVNKLLDYFNKNRQEGFPDIKTQLRDKVNKRVELDRLFIKALGVKISNQELNEIYETMLEEIS
jgi:hypothetical protein